MLPNYSPWIKQLRRTRPVESISKDVDADVAIVGGGIAGVVTAYFTLLQTDKSVVLVEADKIAHGATGHNAGQITSYFERPLLELVEEFGLELAIDGQRSIENGWLLLDQILAETSLTTPLYRFTGYAGLSTYEQVLLHLRNNMYRKEGGLVPEEFFISDEWEKRHDIPHEYEPLYTTVPHANIMSLIESRDKQYIAVISAQKGCMNSALFSEELVQYMLRTFTERFAVYEESPVKTVHLAQGHGSLDVYPHTITARHIVLCTNGFENFHIKNAAGLEIDSKFHHTVNGRIGYMTGYIEPLNHQPTAISYFPKKEAVNDPTGESYFYLTRRPHDHDGVDSYNLICTGGPEKVLPNDALYSRNAESSSDIQNIIAEFLRDTFNTYPHAQKDHAFFWHGLMGYTPSGIRRVGPEPCNPVLLYNLGCNGVGILPSIFGGNRIAQFLSGEKLPHSIFDPHDQYC
jgi:glycine/D-amino acid oxidase-like deaminating enzyme